MFGFGVLLLASAAAAQSVDPNFNYNPRLAHKPNMWGQGVGMLPLTDGWEYRFDGNRANGTTWASQQPPSQVAFRDREGRTRLYTDQPGQAVTLLFTGNGATLGGVLTGGTGFDASSSEYCSVFIDGERAPQRVYTVGNASVLTVGGLQSSGFHNLTFVTGPSFAGTIEIVYGLWQTYMMREGNAVLAEAEYKANIGNRMSFADGNNVQPLLTAQGDVNVEQYQFQNGEQEAALVLKGDASIEVMVPANSTYLECDGYIGPDYGVINFSLDPPPPNNIGSAYWSRSTRRSWYTHDTILSIPLNPNVRYKLKVATEAATAGAGVYLNGSVVLPYSDTAKAPFWIKEPLRSSADATNATNSSNSTITSPIGNPSDNSHVNPSSNDGNSSLGSAAKPKTNVGAIAGGVIGGILVAALIATGLFFFFLRRRRQNARPTSEKIDFTASHEQLNDLRARVISPYQGGDDSLAVHPKAAYAALGSANSSSLSHSLPTDGTSDYFSPLAGRPGLPSSPSQSASQSGSQGQSGSSHGHAPAERTLVTATKAIFTPTSVGPSPVVQERDGGALPVSVPPVYDPSWAQASQGSSNPASNSPQ